MSNGEYETVTNSGVDYQYNTVNSLMDDNYGNIRYYGANPNNYVYFNCDDYSNQSSSTCEVWRIIGVFNNGNLTHQIKIIRNESIGTYQIVEAGNEGISTFFESNLSYLLNNETVSGEATYWSRTLGTCNLNANYKCDFSKSGLKNDETRNLIYSTVGYEFSLLYGDRYPNEVYENEVANTGINDFNISLMYESDYGFAADLRNCSIPLITSSNRICGSNDWLFLGENEWILGATIQTDGTFKENIVHNAGAITQLDISSEANVRPTLYLKTEQTIKSGTGTLADPYQLVIR